MNREKKYPKGEYVVSSTLMVCRREDAKIIFNGTGNIMMPGDLSTDFNETAALANLISAAPELVREVEKSCIRCGWQDDFIGSDIANCPQVKTCGKAKALAKAYGET